MIMDIQKMPNFNKQKIQNGIKSVTHQKIWLTWVHPKGFTPIYSVSCFKHGACNCVAITSLGKIWRCLMCNEGCYEPNEVKLIEL